MPHPAPEAQVHGGTPAPDRGCAGFLIIEVMIALAIFAIGFLAVGNLVVSTTHNNTNGNILTQATLLAADTLEDLKSTPDLATLVVGGPYADPNNPVDARGNAGGIYTRNWSIADPVGKNTSRRIQVTVSWSRLGQNRSITMATITKGKGT
jgi:type II secretory pathway pseudopilin PulG